MQSNTLSRVVLYLSTIVEYRHSKIIHTAPTSKAPNIAIHSKSRVLKLQPKTIIIIGHD